MHAGPVAPPPTAAGASPSPAFSPWSTALCGVLWALLMLEGWGALFSGAPSAWLTRPGESATRMANRDIALAEAAEATSGMRGRLRVFRSGGYEDSLGYAVAIHEEVLAGLAELDATDADVWDAIQRVRAALTILLAEAGDPDAALELAGSIAEGGAFAAAVATAYAPELAAATEQRDRPPPLEAETSRETLLPHGLAAAGLEEWLLARPSIRVLSQTSEGKPAAEALAGDLARRGEGLQVRVEALRAAQLGVVALGLALSLASFWRSRGVGPSPAARPALAAPWSLADGIGVLVRGELWGRLYFYLLAHGTALHLPASLAGPLYDWGGLLSALPLLWLVHRHLLSPRTRSAGQPDPLGLAPRPSALPTLIGVTFATLAIGLIGSEALAWLCWSLGAEGHWAEGFDEALAFDGAGRAWLAASSYLIWAPVFEELAFRGLLYFSLRHRFAPLPAAMLSAALFALVHFYSLPGLLTTFWGGFVWALAFERSRSLWPCIAAHSLYNATFVAWMLLIYR